MHHTDRYSQHSSVIWPVWPNSWVFVYKLSSCGFESRCCHLNFRYGDCFERGVSWHLVKLQSTDSLWKLIRDMIITYSQMHRTDRYSKHSSIIWPVWPNGWVFVYELSGCGFESRCCHLICFHIKICPGLFCLICIFGFEFKKFLMILRYILKVLYLKSFKWLLSKN